MAVSKHSDRLLREMAACGIDIDKLAGGALSAWERRIRRLVMVAHIPDDEKYMSEDLERNLACAPLRIHLGEHSDRWRAYVGLQEEIRREKGR